LPAAFFGPFAIADMAGLDVYRDGFRTLQGQRKLLVNRYTFAMAENNLARRRS
jgi:3-hydroxyacyl-CoA dehydrogenase